MKILTLVFDEPLTDQERKQLNEYIELQEIECDWKVWTKFGALALVTPYNMFGFVKAPVLKAITVAKLGNKISVVDVTNV